MSGYHVAVVLDLTHTFDRKVLGGIAAYFKHVGNWNLYLEQEPQKRLPDFRVWHGDGIIANLDDRKVANAVRGLRVPVVGVGGGFGWYDPATEIPYVSSNNATISRMAFDHLVDRGHRRLAFCGFPSTRINGWSQQRAGAFQQLAQAAGLPCSIYSGRRQTARQWDAMQQEMLAWVGSLPRPVGIMACNDLRARHVLEACRALEIRVPEEIAIVGVDNDDLVCDLMNPPLSSVRQGVRRVGYLAASQLDRRMRAEKLPQTRFFVEPEGVVARRSTDSLAIDDAEVILAAKYIAARSSGKIGVAEVAEVAGLSRSSMERRFKAAMGRTLREEIERVRLEDARRLLEDGILPLKQVAVQAGFGSVQYMTTVFRRRWGQTPGEYRRAVQLK